MQLMHRRDLNHVLLIFVDPLNKGIEARLASANPGCGLHYANNPCIIY